MLHTERQGFESSIAHIMKIWAIGDIHGHYKELVALYEKLEKAGLNPHTDTVVFLGDCVDGGPDTKSVIDWLMGKESQYPHWQFLYGNHEDLMLDAMVYQGAKYHSWDLWWGQGGKQTAYSYYPKNLTKYEQRLIQPKDCIPTSHLTWLSMRPYFYETDDYFFVHAGLNPNLSIAGHKVLMKANVVIRSQAENSVIWIREKFLESNYDWGKTVVFGHTFFPKPFVKNNKIGIDCFSMGNGKLTAVELPEKKFHSVPSQSAIL